MMRMDTGYKTFCRDNKLVRLPLKIILDLA
jgi:hypothetical protein